METLTHWKKFMNPNYLGAYAFAPGQEMILTIKSVVNEEVTDANGKKEMCSVMHFVEAVKPMILNATNNKIIARLYKTPYIERWIGKKIQIYVEKVLAFGEMWDALRIRPFLPTDDSCKCELCGNVIAEYNGVSGPAIARYTLNKYGKMLCSSCAETENKNSKNTDTEGVL